MSLQTLRELANLRHSGILVPLNPIYLDEYTLGPPLCRINTASGLALL